MKRLLLLGACAIGANLIRVHIERAYLRGYRHGLGQLGFDVAMNAANPDTGWADLYDVNYGNEEAL